jgi:hypothetical protein
VLKNGVTGNGPTDVAVVKAALPAGVGHWSSMKTGVELRAVTEFGVATSSGTSGDPDAAQSVVRKGVVVVAIGGNSWVKRIVRAAAVPITEMRSSGITSLVGRWLGIFIFPRDSPSSRIGF